jgi:hypothetical protein
MYDLSKPATLGDVIAWIIAIPVFISTIVCFRVPYVIPQFEKMFMSLHAKLPGITVFILGAPKIMWFVVPLTVSLILGRILMKSSNDGLKVGAAITSSVIVWGLLATAVLGIWMPILELQKQLS